MATIDGGMTVTTREPDAILGGGHPPVLVPGTLKADTTSAVRGLVCAVVTDTTSEDFGLWVAWNPAGDDGSQNACGILANNVNVVGSDSPARFYVHVEANNAALNWGDGTDDEIAAEIAKLRALGVYVQEVA